jgi:hypothetical protein
VRLPLYKGMAGGQTVWFVPRAHLGPIPAPTPVRLAIASVHVLRGRSHNIAASIESNVSLSILRGKRRPSTERAGEAHLSQDQQWGSEKGDARVDTEAARIATAILAI